MPPESRKLLFDVQHAAIGIGMFVQGRTLGDYTGDLMLRSAVERQFEIIGEAIGRLRRIDPDRFGRISEADRIVGFRNVLIHGYDTISDAVTWDIIQQKLPILRREVEAMLNEQPAA